MGMLTSPVAITNTHAVGPVHEGLIAASVEAGEWAGPFTPWALPVVAETYDGVLNDINGFHVRPEHARQALREAHGGPVEEGNVGGGTGMICHGFKGGTGTASRVLDDADGGFSVGVLVQANHGQRRRLTIAGVSVGERIPFSAVPAPGVPEPGQGSISVVVATDAPLLPRQCDRLAHRAGLGIGRTGGLGEDSSGDLILAFSVANRFPSTRDTQPPAVASVSMLLNQRMNPLFEAVVEATEEAILNALLAAETMTGRKGNTAYRLPLDLLLEAMGRS
jgi:D-aminopeptidase